MNWLLMVLGTAKFCKEIFEDFFGLRKKHRGIFILSDTSLKYFVKYWSSMSFFLIFFKWLLFLIPYLRYLIALLNTNFRFSSGLFLEVWLSKYFFIFSTLANSWVFKSLFFNFRIKIDLRIIFSNRPSFFSSSVRTWPVKIFWIVWKRRYIFGDSCS